MASADCHGSATSVFALLLHAVTRSAAPIGTHRSPCQKKKFDVMALIRSGDAVGTGMTQPQTGLQYKLVCGESAVKTLGNISLPLGGSRFSVRIPDPRFPIPGAQSA
jgi:hypothetical protein